MGKVEEEGVEGMESVSKGFAKFSAVFVR